MTIEVHCKVDCLSKHCYSLKRMMYPSSTMSVIISDPLILSHQMRRDPMPTTMVANVADDADKLLQEVPWLMLLWLDDKIGRNLIEGWRMWDTEESYGCELSLSSSDLSFYSCITVATEHLDPLL